MRHRTILIPVLFGCAALIAALSWALTRDRPLDVTSKWLYTVPEGLSVSREILPTDGHWACDGWRGADPLTIVDGQLHETHHETFAIVSPEAARTALLVHEQPRWRIILDGRSEEAYDVVKWPLFSDDGRHFAYMAGSDKGQFVILDGVRQKVYDSVEWPLFSDDGRTVTHAATEGAKHFMVVNGVEQKAYDAVGVPMRNPVTGALIYPAASGDEAFVVVDGVEQTHYDHPKGAELRLHIRISPDGKRMAYSATRRDKQIAILDGKIVAEHEPPKDPMFSPDFSFSPDSKRFAFAVVRDGKAHAVVDGVEQKAYDSADTFAFSPDSRHLAYIAAKGDKAFMVFDGVESAAYDVVIWPCFSPRGGRFAYIALRRNAPIEEVFVVLDGVEQKAYDFVGDLYFSPDGDHYAYVAYNGRKWFAVVDGVEQLGIESLKPCAASAEAGEVFAWYGWKGPTCEAPIGTRGSGKQKITTVETRMLPGAKLYRYSAVRGG
jgi:hypothetical protein